MFNQLPWPGKVMAVLILVIMVLKLINMCIEFSRRNVAHYRAFRARWLKLDSSSAAPAPRGR